ncbi:MAG: asparagine synthetase A [Candidatus Njordarchaeia archaeon]
MTKTLDKFVPEIKIFKRHLFLKEKKYKALAFLQFKLLKIVRGFLYRRGFIELVSPIIAPISDPGLRMGNMMKFDFYGMEAVFVSSAILYKYAGLKISDRIFYFAPNVRVEPIDFWDFDRTLSEFRQIDLEMAKVKRKDVMRLSEEFLVQIIGSIKKTAEEELEIFSRELRVPHMPFKVVKFDEAVEIAKEAGYDLETSGELSKQAESYISKIHREPVWIIDYPSHVRGFYYRETDDGKLNDMDLLYPEGFGEAASGGEREVNPIKIRSRMLKTGVDPRKYLWFFELLYDGVPECAGIGFGFERLVRYIIGVQSIIDATLFPRAPGYVGI